MLLAKTKAHESEIKWQEKRIHALSVKCQDKDQKMDQLKSTVEELKA